VDAYTGVAVRNPLLRVDDLPVRVDIRRAGRDVRVLGAHDPPLVRVSVLEVEALRVRPVAQDDGVRALLERAEDVGTEDESVVHLDRDVPIDAQSLANLRHRSSPGT